MARKTTDAEAEAYIGGATHVFTFHEGGSPGGRDIDVIGMLQRNEDGTYQAGSQPDAERFSAQELVRARPFQG